VELSHKPWDTVICPPGSDPRYRETTFGLGAGIAGFYVDDDAQIIRIFDILWAD
jgi:hypothetical protein